MNEKLNHGRKAEQFRSRKKTRNGTKPSRENPFPPVDPESRKKEVEEVSKRFGGCPVTARIKQPDGKEITFSTGKDKT